MECDAVWTMCNRVCVVPECRAECSTNHTACMHDSVPCTISVPGTPAPPLPSSHDTEMIAALTQEALSLTNGVYFATAPHTLPYMGVTVIGKGEFLQSPSGLYVLQFQENGDLGLFSGNVQLWQAPRTENRGSPGHVEFDPKTGVMSMYSMTDELWWDSRMVTRNVRRCYIRNPWRTWYCQMVPQPFHNPVPSGTAPYELRMTDHGNVEIVDATGKVFFETATSHQGMLISDITATAAYATGRTPSENLLGFLGGWSMVPVAVKVMFETAAYGKEDQWEVFSIHFTPDQGVVEEWVGATQQSNGTISLLYLHIKSVGTPVQQYRPVQVPSCHRCWFHSCCSTHTVNVPRGFEANELVSMVIALRRAGFFALESIIATL